MAEEETQTATDSYLAMIARHEGTASELKQTGTPPEQMEGWGWQSVHDESVLPLVCPAVLAEST